MRYLRAMKTVSSRLEHSRWKQEIDFFAFGSETAKNPFRLAGYDTRYRKLESFTYTNDRTSLELTMQ